MELCFYFLASFMFLVMVNGFHEQERKHYSSSYLASGNVVDVMKARLVSDLVGTTKTGFVMRRLIFFGPEKTQSVRYQQQKRAIPSLVSKGRLAANYLIQGTKPLGSRTPDHKRFGKRGNFHTALHDFYSVGPRNVRIVTQGNKISRVSGQVGDRQLFLTKCSPGENCLPVLEIRNSEATLHDAPILYDLLGIPCDKIVYKKSFK